MATTEPKKRKLSWITLLSFIMAVLPAVLDLLNKGSRKATIDLEFDVDRQKLKATVDDIEGASSVTRTLSNK